MAGGSHASGDAETDKTPWARGYGDVYVLTVPGEWKVVLIAVILCVLIKNTVVLSFFGHKVLYNRGIVQNIVYDNRGTVQFL